MEADPRRDIRESIAYPKRWTEKMNPRVPFQEYPKMPTIRDRDAKGELTGKADVPIYDKQRQPLIWQTAREEAEWLEAHPKEAALISEAREHAPKTLDNATQELSATKDTNKRLLAERDKAEGDAQKALDELAAAKAELAQLRKAKAGPGVPPEAATPGYIHTSDGTIEKTTKLDMRTKAGRAAAKAAAEG